MSDRLSLRSSTSLASSHVATLQSGTCHVAWRRATTDSHCSMLTLAGNPGSDQPPDIPSPDDGCSSLQPGLQDEEGQVADLCCSSVQLVVFKS